MKTFITAIVAAFSLSAFANLAEINATNDEIRDAIIVSLLENDLNCVNKVTNKTMKASVLKISTVFKDNYSLNVSTDLSQPLIVMEKRTSPTSKNVMVVTTDRELKRVTKLDILSFDEMRTVRVNVGTILNPVFVDKLIEGKPFENIECL